MKLIWKTFNNLSIYNNAGNINKLLSNYLITNNSNYIITQDNKYLKYEI
jgi:hypothetical protein